jgi:hypothetical protein
LTFCVVNTGKTYLGNILSGWEHIWNLIIDFTLCGRSFWRTNASF